MRTHYLSGSKAAAAKLALGIEGLNDIELGEMRDRADEAFRESGEMISAAEKASDITDGIEDVAALLENRPADAGPLTETETGLIAVVGQSAVSGTDLDRTEVLPALEGEDSGNPASYAQRLKARVKAIIAEIIKIRDRIIKAITDFFYNYLGEVPTVRRHIESVTKRLDKVKGGKGHGEFEIADSGPLYIDGRPITTGSGLLTAAKEVANASNFVFDRVATTVEKRGNALAEALSGLGKGDHSIRDRAAALVTRLTGRDLGFPEVPGQSKKNSERFADADLFLGKSLLGGKSLGTKQARASDAKGGLLNQMAAVRNTSIVLVPTSISASRHSPISFTAMSETEIRDAMKIAGELLTQVENWKRGSAFEKMKAISERVKKASEAGGEALAKSEGEDISVLKGMLHFNITFATWMRNPFQEQLRYNVTVAKLLISLANRSLQQFEVK